MTNSQAKDLFQLQSELIDVKVEMAVSKATDRVIEQIHGLKSDINGLRNEMHSEIHGLRNDMNDRFFALGQRVTAIETNLGMSTETKSQVRSKLIEYGFKAIWAILTVVFACFILQLQALIK